MPRSDVTVHLKRLEVDSVECARSGCDLKECLVARQAPIAAITPQAPAKRVPFRSRFILNERDVEVDTSLE
jgi:hypothetical protein